MRWLLPTERARGTKSVETSEVPLPYLEYRQRAAARSAEGHAGHVAAREHQDDW